MSNANIEIDNMLSISMNANNNCHNLTLQLTFDNAILDTVVPMYLLSSFNSEPSTLNRINIHVSIIFRELSRQNLLKTKLFRYWVRF